MTASQPPYEDDVREEKARDDARETAADDADAKAYIRKVLLGWRTKAEVEVCATTYSRPGEPDDLDDPDIYIYVGGAEFCVRLARTWDAEHRTEFAKAILKAKPEIIEEETR